MSGGRLRVAWLDYARMASALAVMAFHYLWNAPHQNLVDFSFGPLGHVAAHGYLGVDLFFVISGFVILQSISGATPDRFVVGRLTRLYPAFLLCMTVTFVSRGLPWSQYPAQLTMMPTYFGQMPADGVYWTLAVEMKFYAFMLIVLLLNGLRRFEWVLLVCIIILALWSPSRHNPGHYLEFAAGCALAMIYREGFKLGPSLCLGLAAPFVVITAVRGAPPHTSHLAIGLVTSGIFIVFLALRGRKLPTRFSEPVGALTYPLYLLHGQMGYAAMRLFCTDQNKAWAVPLIMVAAIAAAWGVSRYEAWSRPWWKRSFDRAIGAPIRWLLALAAGRRTQEAPEPA